MTLENLIKNVNNYYNVDVRENSRQRDIVMARAAFYWLARNTTRFSMKVISEAVGRDHASVIHSLKNIDDWIRFDKAFNQRFENLKKLVFNEINDYTISAESMVYKYNSLLIENDILIFIGEFERSEIRNIIGVLDNEI